MYLKESMTYYSRRMKEYEPKSNEGCIYYVRLKTDVGLLYKFGYTTLESVKDRLGYGGSTDAKMIDKVLIFVKLDNAADVERAVHRHFSRKRTFGRGLDPSMPLYRNGQSEIYAEDILNADKDFTKSQLEETKRSIRQARYPSINSSKKEAPKIKTEQQIKDEIAINKFVNSIGWVFDFIVFAGGLVIKLFDVLERLNASDSSKIVYGLLEKVPSYVQHTTRIQEIEAQRQLDEMREKIMKLKREREADQEFDRLFGVSMERDTAV